MNDVEFRIRAEGRNALQRICADAYYAFGAAPFGPDEFESALCSCRAADMVAVTLFYRLQSNGSTLDTIDAEDVMLWLVAAVKRYCADRYKREHLEAEAEEAETA